MKSIKNALFLKKGSPPGEPKNFWSLRAVAPQLPPPAGQSFFASFCSQKEVAYLA
jgi:hypothetical protein